MADNDNRVPMVVTREPYSLYGQSYGVGDVVWVSPAGRDAMLDANPPYGREATDNDVGTRQPPDLPASARPAPVPEDINATEEAIARAQQHGLNLALFADRGSGKDGRITVADVEQWSRDNGLIP